MIKKMIPTFYYKSIYDIPYDELKNNGIKLILTDLDNTLISYAEEMPYDKLFEWKKNILDMGFELIIVSNSRKNRVDKFAKAFDVPYVKFSMKPLRFGIYKAIRKVASKKYAKNEILLMGDQIMTDIWGGNRARINTALIEPIDKSTDVKSTQNNRKMEEKVLIKIEKKYPNEYNTKLKEFGGGLR